MLVLEGQRGRGGRLLVEAVAGDDVIVDPVFIGVLEPDLGISVGGGSGAVAQIPTAGAQLAVDKVLMEIGLLAGGPGELGMEGIFHGGNILGRDGGQVVEEILDVPFGRIAPAGCDHMEVTYVVPDHQGIGQAVGHGAGTDRRCRRPGVVGWAGRFPGDGVGVGRSILVSYEDITIGRNGHGWHRGITGGDGHDIVYGIGLRVIAAVFDAVGRAVLLLPDEMEQIIAGTDVLRDGVGHLRLNRPADIREIRGGLTRIICPNVFGPLNVVGYVTAIRVIDTVGVHQMNVVIGIGIWTDILPPIHRIGGPNLSFITPIGALPNAIPDGPVKLLLAADHGRILVRPNGENLIVAAVYEIARFLPTGTNSRRPQSCCAWLRYRDGEIVYIPTRNVAVEEGALIFRIGVHAVLELRCVGY